MSTIKKETEMLDKIANAVLHKAEGKDMKSDVEEKVVSRCQECGKKIRAVCIPTFT